MANSRLAALSFLGVIVLAACAPGEVRESELDDYLCSTRALGDDFKELIRGDFTPRDLADLSSDAGASQRQYAAVGMRSGKFVFYKEVLPKPPFEPPLNVVCQAMEFETAAGVAAWVAALDESSAVEALAFGRVPGQPEAAEVLPMGGSLRDFTITGGEGDEYTTVLLRVGADGRYARLVAIGRSGGTAPADELLDALWRPQ